MGKSFFLYESNIPFPSEKITLWLLQPTFFKKASLPFKKGHHTSQIIDLGGKTSLIQDRVEVVLPLLCFKKRAEKKIQRFIFQRNEALKRDLQRLQRFPFLASCRRVLISGASGFIGTALFDFLEIAGCEVLSLTRKKGKENSIFWDPEQKIASLEDFEGFDAVVHLAGESLAKGVWTQRAKKKILESRKKGTEFLSDILSKVKEPPSVFISASAIGYYGNSLSPVTEESPPGTGFLSKVCLVWETASKSLEKKGIRVCHARFGIVLSPLGGMLKAIIPIFRWGFGGVFGSGKQINSWIDLEDVLGALYHILHSTELSGPINVVSPFAVSEEEFAHLLAKALKKPCFFSYPRFLFPGEKARELLFSSLEVLPFKLETSGFIFSYPKLWMSLQRFFKDCKDI